MIDAFVLLFELSWDTAFVLLVKLFNRTVSAMEWTHVAMYKGNSAHLNLLSLFGWCLTQTYFSLIDRREHTLRHLGCQYQPLLMIQLSLVDRDIAYFLEGHIF